MNTSLCVFCRKSLIGRTDKQYCNDYCRAAFHNNKKRAEYRNDCMRIINAFIKKNRNILKSVLEQELNHITSGELLIRGFSFSFFTHESISNTGDVFRFCYDYGYLINKDGVVLIIDAK